MIAEVDEGDNQSGIPEITPKPLTDVYGKALTPPTPAAKHGFVGGLGHTTDADTGLMYMRARYYDPAIGRFVSQDPARNGAYWYAYCNNNPTNMVDVDGQFAIMAVLLPVAIWAVRIAIIITVLYLLIESFKCADTPPGAGGLGRPIIDPEQLNREQRRHGIPPPGGRVGIEGAADAVACIVGMRNDLLDEAATIALEA